MSVGASGQKCTKGFILGISLGVALLMMVVGALGGCGDGDSSEPTLPPATIMRASDGTTATIAPTRPVPSPTPSPPPKLTPTVRQKDYPYPAGQSQASPTPMAYPAK